MILYCIYYLCLLREESLFQYIIAINIGDLFTTDVFCFQRYVRSLESELCAV